MNSNTYKSLMKEMSNLISTSTKNQVGVSTPTNTTPTNDSSVTGKNSRVKTNTQQIPRVQGTIKPIQSIKPINTTKTSPQMESQRYHNMRDAYRAMYEAKGYQEGGEVKPDKDDTPSVSGGLTAAVVLPKPSVTRVNIEVNKQETKVGEVEQAYYTFPAGFDPTNREDVASKSKKVEYKAEQHEISAGDVLDYLLESGIVETVEGAEALYTHMSIEWMDSIVDGLIEEKK